MREINKYIEQLEEATHLLTKKTSTGARLALLLIDNLAELFMYNKIKEIFARDDYIRAVIKPKYSIKKREKVENFFKDKCVFLVNYAKMINEDEKNIIIIGHYFRNEAYHNGIIRDNIILCIAQTYFKTLCKILPHLWKGSYSFSNIDEIEKFLIKYDIKRSIIDKEVLIQICDKLLEGNECSTSDFCKLLSKDLLKRIEDLINDLSDLSIDIYEGKKKDEILKELQFNKESIVECNTSKSEESMKEFFNRRERLLTEYKPRITFQTVEQWKKQAIHIESEKSSGRAIRKFYDIDKKLITISNIVEEVFLYFDELVDSEINHRLNK
jgi:hypothetical protein